MQEDAPIDWEPDVPARRRCEQTGTDPAKAVKACERFAGVPGASVKACEKDFCKLGGADLVNLQEDVLIERLRDDDPKLPATVTCPEGYTPRGRRSPTRAALKATAGVRPAAAAPAASAAAVAVAAAVAAALLRPSDPEMFLTAPSARDDERRLMRALRGFLRQPAPAHSRLPHAVPAPAGQGDVRRAATGPRRVPWPLGRRQSVGEGGGRRREHAAPPPPRAVAATARGRARRAPVRAAA